MAHAKWSPSSAHRWMECFASMAEELPYERVGTSIFADEGTAAHTLMEWTLQDLNRTTYDYPDPTITVTTVNDDGMVVGENVIEVNEEMRDCVQSVVDFVRFLVKEEDFTLLCEQRVDFSKLIGIENQFGTADIILVSPNGEDVIVADLKYGKGVKVYAERNHQMLCYGAGVLETFDGLLGDFKNFTLVVMQPRIKGDDRDWHLDEWMCTREDVLEHAGKMRVAAENNVAAMAWMQKGKTIPDKFYAPGLKTCQWCKAKASCAKLEKMVVDEVMDDFSDLDVEVKQQQMMLGGPPPPKADRLGIAFANLDMIEEWCRAVRAECERQVMAGMTVMGVDGLPLKVIEGRRGDRKWKDEAQAEALLIGQLPPDKVYTRKLISPSQAAKILDKKKTQATWENFKPLIEQAPGRPKVVEGSAEGVPYVGAASADEFETLEEVP